MCKLFRRLCTFILCAIMLMAFGTAAEAADNHDKGKIIFIPHDNRPVSDQQAADTIRNLGYEVIVPPDNMLGGRDFLGDPDALWCWLEEQTGKGKNSDKKKNIKAVVMSADSMIYGSLVASRKHELPEAKLKERVSRFAAYHKLHPSLPVYVWSSIMRTPKSGRYSGSEEPEYYKSYGQDIFRYTALMDKAEAESLDEREKKELAFLTTLIPPDALADWMARRNKNFAVNKAMIDLARKNVFTYYAIGRDDNAPYSQTHMESRRLSQYAKSLGSNNFQNMAGIDEFAMLLLTRAVNELNGEKPLVYVKYNWGEGPRTIPSYSDEPISKTISEHIISAGGKSAMNAQEADLVLLVNTYPDGTTSEANWAVNGDNLKPSDRFFANLVAEAVASGQHVAVADVAYANGADNALLTEMRRQGLLFKIQAYSGWNTATNSTGFVLGQGMLTRHMEVAAKNQLLLIRYLDDWAYQANVRQSMSRQLGWFKGEGMYSDLAGKQDIIEMRTTRMMNSFVANNFPPLKGLGEIEVTFPWRRMFEAGIKFAIK